MHLNTSLQEHNLKNKLEKSVDYCASDFLIVKTKILF